MTELEQKIMQLKELQKKMYAFTYASNSIYLDAATVAPRDTQDARNEVMAILSEYSYELSTCKETEALLTYLSSHAAELDEHTAREVELMLRDKEYVSSIPQDEFIEYQRLVGNSEHIWHEAKEKSDFSLFKPYLEKMFETQKRFALYFRPDDDPYQTQLSLFERGLTVEKCDDFFAKLRESIVPLLKKVTSAPQIDDAPLKGHFPAEKQKQLTEYLMQFIGIDGDHCVCGETEHPFTLDFGRNDVRITTHYYEDLLLSSMYSVIHEGGHALYELCGGSEHDYTVVAGGVSMGVHECQSRFYENIIGKSRAFTTAVLPKIKELFPELDGITPDEFYRIVNRAEPSLIRTEADELTYCLHVMVRYEIEKKVFSGELAVEEIPTEWNRLYKEYLGVEVPDDASGCLQDSHWSGGAIGYFPSYALGSAYGAQMLDVMKRDISPEAACASGDLTPIKAWLTENVWKYAKLYDPEILLERVFGGKFDPKYYIEYLENKFSEIYGL